MKTGFHGFEVDTNQLELKGPDGVVPVEPQVFRLLHLLIEHRDRVVSKDELIEHIWAGRIVSDAAVTSRINLLRAAVGDSGARQKVIKTYPKRGYRFVAEVTPETDQNLTEAGTGRAGEGAFGIASDAARKPPGVVVLPFRNLSEASGTDFLAEGITEEISVALSRCSDVAVIAVRSAMAVQETAPQMSDVGHRLGVRYVVRGTVRRAAGRIRVTARTIDTETGKHLWAENFEGEDGDIFDIQDKVARSVAAVLPTRIQGARFQRQLKHQTQDISGYEVYLKVIWTLRQTGGLFEAIEELNKLLITDPDYALAHAQLAVLLGFSPFVSGRDDPEVVAKSVAHIRRALALEPADERVQTKAGLAFLDAGDFARALRFSEQALKLNPHSVEAIHFRGCILGATGNYQDALEHQHTAMQLDPLFPGHYYENQIESYYLLKQYDQAISVYENWDKPHAHMPATMAACYAMRGDDEEAKHLAAEYLETRPPGYRVKDHLSAVMRYHALERDSSIGAKGFCAPG